MDGLSLESLSAEPRWRGRTVVLGGRVERTAVRSVSLAVGTDGLAADRDALLVLTTAPGGDAASAWRLDAVLRRAADAGVVAVLLPSLSPLPDATRLLCSRLALCVLGTGADVLDLATAAAVALEAPDLLRARAVLAVQGPVSAGRVTGARALVALLQETLAVPVALLDARGDHLEGEVGVAPPRVTEPVAHRVAVPGAGATLVAQPVLLPGLVAAQRWLVAQVPTLRADVVAAAGECLAVAAAALAGWLATGRLTLERDARLRAGLLADVLRLGDHPPPEVRRRVAAAGWPLEGWHVGVRVGTGPDVDTAGLREEVAAVFSGAGVEAVFAEHGDGWSGWWSTPREPGAAAVRALAEATRSAHRTLQRRQPCWTGVGRPHPGPGGIARTLAEAADAARLAASRPERGRFVNIDQLGVAQLLLEWTQTSTFEPAARTLLAPLGDPDGGLIRTLGAYLDAGTSLVETAAVLGVHRNTVAARVARVEAVLQVDLRDPDQRLALHLACRALKGPGSGGA